MAIPKGKGRELCPVGTHNARCVRVIEMGTHIVEFNGKEKEQSRVQLGFQLVDEESSSGNAMVAYKEFNYTDNPGSDLMKTLKAWMKVEDGDFDIATCIDQPCLVTIEHKKGTDNKTRDKIVSIVAVPKGLKVKKATEEFVTLTFDDFDEDVFDKLPEWLKTKIAGTTEYLEATAPKGKKKPVTAPAKTGKKK